MIDKSHKSYGVGDPNMDMLRCKYCGVMIERKDLRQECPRYPIPHRNYTEHVRQLRAMGYRVNGSTGNVLNNPEQS